MNTGINKTIKHGALALLLGLSVSSCDKFVFGDIHPNYDDNPLLKKSIPQSGADKYIDSLKKIRVTDNLANPDPDGAFKDWATCLVMFKEGHSHGDGMMHGNFVYPKAPWK